MSFKIPRSDEERLEAVKGLDLAALNTLLDEAKAAGRAIVEKDKFTSEDGKDAEDIMTLMEKVEADIAALEKDEADSAAALEKARGRFAEAEEVEDDDADEADEADDAEAEEVEVAEEAVAVAASAKSPVRNAAKNAPKVKVAPKVAAPVAVITAAADVPGISTGAEITDFTEVGTAMVSRMSRLPKHAIPGGPVRNRYGVAQVNLAAARTDGLWVGNPDFRDEQEVVMAASREARLSGSSLTAAGGWCSPSETLYDFCVEESTDGIIDVPSVTASRGGIRYTKGPDFATLYADADLGWNWTEAEVIAEAEPKPCIEVVCPDFTDVRLRAVGLCIKAGLLTNATYPELVRRYIEAAFIAHQHKVAAYLYSTIATGSTTTQTTPTDTALDGLTQLEFMAEFERQRQRMAFGTTMEVLLPVWYKAVIRGELARRTGVEAWNVSDQQIDSYFTARKMRVQWLYNTGQDLTLGGGNVLLPGGTVQVVMYPAGTWVKATTDVISLDAVYDSVGLSANTYTAMFVEEGLALVNPCGRSVKGTLSYCISGQTGAAILEACVIPASV